VRYLARWRGAALLLWVELSVASGCVRFVSSSSESSATLDRQRSPESSGWRELGVLDRTPLTDLRDRQECARSCGSRRCGDDGCGGSCGPCASDEVCSSGGQCVAWNTGWSAPVLLEPPSDLATGDNDGEPTLTADLLELYFSSERAGGTDIWVAKRASVSLPWDLPTAVAELNSTSRDIPGGVSGDGLTMAVASDRPGGTDGWDIWISTRDTRSAPWRSPTVVTSLNTTSDEIPSFISNDGLLILFHSSRVAQHESSIFSSTRSSATAPWGTPVNITELNSSGSFNGWARLSADGLTVVFDSNRSGGPGLRDLYTAVRSATASPFGTPALIAPLSTTADDTSPWISVDHHRIFFARNPLSSTGLFDPPFKLYEAQR